MRHNVALVLTVVGVIEGMLRDGQSGGDEAPPDYEPV